MRGEKITCRKFVGFVGGYHDGELPGDQRSVFEAHLAQCQKCREYLKSYEATVRLAKAAMKNPEQAVPEELVKAILTARSRQR